VRAFVTITVGQLASLIGSRLTAFAFSLWALERLGSVTSFSLIAICAAVPGLLLGPWLGALVDRWGGERALAVGTAGAAATATATLLLARGDALAISTVCLLAAWSSLWFSLRWTALVALAAARVPLEHQGRASGLVQLGSGGAHVLAPILAGALLPRAGIAGVALIEIAGHAIALATLVAVGRVRAPRPAQETGAGLSMRDAWRFIATHAGLQALMILAAVINMVVGAVEVLVPPFVMSFSSTAGVGRVLSAAGVGVIVGSVAVATFGVPARRVRFVLAITLVQSLALSLVLLPPSEAIVAVAATAFMLGFPAIDASVQAIWMSKVPVALQGRVHGLRRISSWCGLLLGYLVAAPLADHVFVPLFSVRQGTAILLSAIAIAFAVVSTLLCCLPPLRSVERDLADAAPSLP